MAVAPAVTCRGASAARTRSTSETEYRRTLTADGLWGAVAFLNGTMTANPETGIFGRADPGFGVGLRMKFNKHTNTNLTIDYGWGRDVSHALFLGMTEVF